MARTAQLGRGQTGVAQLGSASTSSVASFYMSPSAGHTAGARTINVTYTGAVTVASNPFTIVSGPGAISAYVQDSTTTCHFTLTQAGVSSTPTIIYDSVTLSNQSYSNAAVAPVAPTIGTLTDNLNGTITITGTAPADDGGATITSYTATDSYGGIAATNATLPITLTGITVGVAQTVTLTATNSAGTSVPSNASNSVTPFSPNASQTKLAPFVASDVLGTVLAQAFKNVSGTMTSTGSAPTINTVANIANGREAIFSVPADSYGGFHGVARWCTGGASPQYFCDELNVPPTNSSGTYTITKVCNLPQGTNIAGTIGYQLFNGANVAIGARTTAGIIATPLVTGPDKFSADITLAPGSYFVVWDNGSGVYSQDELLVIASGSYSGAAPPVNSGAAGTITFPAFKIDTLGVQQNLAITTMYVQTLSGIVVATLTSQIANNAGVIFETHANFIIGTTYFVWGVTATGSYFHNVLVAT